MLSDKHSITESVLCTAVKKHFLMIAVFIYMAIYALRALNTVIFGLIEKLCSFPNCILSHFREENNI